jgi:hypothetical protein
MPGEVARVVALGASNLTRGFPTVVATARSAWGRNVEVLAALGHGRSYGALSDLAFRTLPGILQSDLWRELSSRPPAATRALVTDVGNDILYGFSAAQTLEWTAEAVDRLQRITKDVVLTDLPIVTIRRLTNEKFLFFRTIFAPQCRLSLAHVVDTAERVTEGLETLAASRSLRFCRLKPAWYGTDPIHIRLSAWRPAWQEILCGEGDVRHAPAPLLEGLRLYLMRPERQWLFGLERLSPQTGVALALGARVWLY